MFSLVLGCEKLSSDRTSTFHTPGHYVHSITVKKWERQAASRIRPEVPKSAGRTTSTGELLVILSKSYPILEREYRFRAYRLTKVVYPNKCVASFFLLFLSPPFHFGSKDCSRGDHRYSRDPERERTSSNNAIVLYVII